MSQLVYTRLESGNVPVQVVDDSGVKRYLVKSPMGTKQYSSARQLLIALTGHPHGRHWTFDRYFRLGRYGSSVGGDFSIMDLVGPGGWAVGVSSFSKEVFFTHSSRCRDGGLVTSGDGYPLGIDLAKRGKEVAKLLFSGYGGMIQAGHYDPEDVLQEVYRGILIRNKGTCPFDARKASFGHYVHMVCGCILANYHRHNQRSLSIDHVGAPGWDDDGEFGVLDAGDDRVMNSIDIQSGDTVPESLLLEDVEIMLGSKNQLALRVLPLLREGYSRTEIAEQLGESRVSIAKACGLIQQKIRHAYA